MKYFRPFLKKYGKYSYHLLACGRQIPKSYVYGWRVMLPHFEGRIFTERFAAILLLCCLTLEVEYTKVCITILLLCCRTLEVEYSHKVMLNNTTVMLLHFGGRIWIESYVAALYSFEGDSHKGMQVSAVVKSKTVFRENHTKVCR